MVLRDTEDVKWSVFNLQDFTNSISILSVYSEVQFAILVNALQHLLIV